MAYGTFFAHGAVHATGSMFEPLSNVISSTANTLMLAHRPDPKLLFELALRGWISFATLDKYISFSGIPINLSGQGGAVRNIDPTSPDARLWKAAFEAGQELPTPEQLGVIRNRGLIQDGGLDLGLRRLGFYNEVVRGQMANLRFEVPGPSDLVRFAVRHAFEPELVKHFDFDAERKDGPFLLDIFHQAAGINYPIFTGPLADTVQLVTGRPAAEIAQLYTGSGIPEPTWAQIYWWSHWVMPSPSQGYEMLFRLRPDRDRRFDPPFATDLNFGINVLNLLLRANDYPPFYRRALAAIAYRIPGIRFLRQLRSTDVFQQKDVVELLLRQGYSPGDAEVLAESVERNNRDQRQRAIETQAKGQLARYWELGAISQDQYIALLVKHGLTQSDAVATAQLAELDLEFKRLEKIVSFVRRQFIKGVVGADEASGLLHQAGITPQRALVYLEDWQMELKEEHREVSAQKGIQWACKGIISVADLQKRLENLGYRPQDVAGLIAEAVACSADRAARAAAAGVREREKSQRELRRLQKEAAQAIVAARRQLAAHGNPAQLRKWYCEGTLGQAELYSRLRSLNWPDADITRLIGDCKVGQGKGSGGKRGGTALGGGGAGAGP
jgi:hypothetical protein